jgi:hypothetical protein
MVWNVQIKSGALLMVAVCIVVLGFGILMIVNQAQATVTSDQVGVTNTPLGLSLPSPTPIVTTAGTAAATAQATFTPTSESDAPVQLRAREEAGSVNVRFEANSDSELVGSIRFDDLYVVTGRYFRWIQIRFDPSPDGTGWVFDDLVEVIGDISTVPDLALAPEPTQDPAVAGATQTFEAIASAPGGFLTVTAGAREITAPSGVGNPASSAVAVTGDATVGGNLPTFTPPPNVPTTVAVDPLLENQTDATPVGPAPATQTGAEGIAPIVPIIVLGGLGILGLLIASLRR